LLALRLLEGITAGGVPAVAMAYLSEEMHPARLGRAMGIYISGNAFGGMLGRLLAGAFADLAGWRAAMAALAVMGLIAAVIFVRVLPASRNFRPASVQGLAYHGVTFAGLIGQRQLALLLAFGFLVVGPFVTIYDYAGYRLIAPPYALGQTAIGAIFIVYVFGIAGSTLSGRVADRVDRRTMLTLNLLVVLAGLLLTLAEPLWAIVAGIAMVTFGFFGAHTVASAWVGQLGKRSKGHASALYLFSFYAGLSVLGSTGGWFWQVGGWSGLVALAAGLAIAGLAVAFSLRRQDRA
jgi:YNFM family putative membrane transporter